MGKTKRNAGHGSLTGLLLIAALLELVVIVYLLLPTGREPAAAGQDAVQTKPLQQEELPPDGLQTLTASQLYASPPPEAQDAPEAEKEPEIQEKSKPEGERSATEILADARVVAHGMGSIGGLVTPNCLEGFLAQYDAGVRVFEADLRLTRDVKNILRHDWWRTWQDGIDWVHIPTREKFLAEKIQDEYTPLSFQDLLLLMEAYPDICIVTDTKFTESDVFSIQFDSMLADAHELGLTYLFDRIAIQVYDGNMRTGLHNIYPFPHYIYTLYQDSSFTGTAESFRTKAAYCAEHGMEGITVDKSLWKAAFAGIAHEYGIKVYVHTVNDTAEARKFLDAGCDGIYSDSLTPGDLS